MTAIVDRWMGSLKFPTSATHTWLQLCCLGLWPYHFIGDYQHVL